MKVRNVERMLDIPVIDFERARKFYSAIWLFDIKTQEINGKRIGLFPYESSQGVACGIVDSFDSKGVSFSEIIYLNCPRDISIILDRVKKEGGSVIEPFTRISKILGSYAIFKDTEGNKIHLHSLQKTKFSMY